jgi:small subunit ribosomal protein S2
MRQLFEAKVHLGHLTRFREPKMVPFIFDIRNKMHLIDLNKTQVHLEEALRFLRQLGERRGSKILFVGTKRIAQSVIKEQATRAGMPYVDRYWLGGTLTNYRTIRDSVKRLKDMEATQQQGGLEGLTKKEIRNLERKQARLERGVGGIKDMAGLPDALFVVDVGYEKIAVSEAQKLKIPIIGVVDTNHSPEGIDYVIPGNDDAMAAVRLYTTLAADAILEGRKSVVEPASEAAPQPIIKKVKKPLVNLKSASSAEIDSEKDDEKSNESNEAII